MAERNTRNILIVGGSSGIGLELVRRLADAGDNVTVWSRSCPPGLEILGTNHHVVDVMKPLGGQDARVPSPLHGIATVPVPLPSCLSPG